MSLELKESAIQIEETSADNVLVCEVKGKLTKEDYGTFVPVLEDAIKRHGKIRLLFLMTDFKGWELSALWEDVKFDAKHFAHIERLAMVGDKAWERGMAVFCKPFTTAKVKYFDRAELAEAKRWIVA